MLKSFFNFTLVLYLILLAMLLEEFAKCEPKFGSLTPRTGGTYDQTKPLVCSNEKYEEKDHYYSCDLGTEVNGGFVHCEPKNTCVQNKKERQIAMKICGELADRYVALLDGDKMVACVKKPQYY